MKVTQFFCLLPVWRSIDFDFGDDGFSSPIASSQKYEVGYAAATSLRIASECCRGASQINRIFRQPSVPAQLCIGTG
jgi:hypothetical protein